ncbi:MAG TPA: methylated-DNA--[protein]-cysteine S-methyltransferase, partial [Longimicrobiales bacterium]|nr:methylated-DNA--[protein]-cysteine S-methyltransferase [Longimicrobiales bacterium]
MPTTRAGAVTLWVSSTGVRRIEFGPLPRGSRDEPPEERPPLLADAVGQLEEYFARERRAFELPLDFPETTTDFQHDVYRRLMEIEYGHVASYGQIAREIGKPDMARSVGQAVGSNPLPIVVPCH